LFITSHALILSREGLMEEPVLNLGKLRKALRKELSGHKDVLCVYLFGSKARGESAKLSDVDVAVLLGTHRRGAILDVVEVLIKALGDKVDVADLRQLPLTIQYRVVKDGLTLYVKDEKTRIRFEDTVLDEYLDMEPHRREYVERWLQNLE